MNEIVPIRECAVVIARRERAQMPEVMAALSPVEMAVYVAASSRSVQTYSGVELAREIKDALKWIKKDLGVRATGEDDEAYLVIRIVKLLQRYYPTMTVKEFKIAFEMLMAGELDAFLPKGSNGLPDRNHYQAFNADYICKVLNAYKGRRMPILRKASDAAPKAEQARDYESEAQQMAIIRRGCVSAFLHFKYRGWLPKITPIAEMLYHKMLSDAGLADEIEVTLQEQTIILQRMLTEYLDAGKFGDYNDLCKKGTSAPELEYGSIALARRRALERAFARMADEELQITDYIKI